MRAFFALVFLGLLQCGCTNLFFFPQSAHVRTPAAADIAYDDVWLQTQDSITLHAWWMYPSTDSPRGTILFVHGNAENISTHIASVVWLVRAGYAVLALDYRGYGRSAGAPSVDGALEDIRTAMSWLVEHPGAPTPRFLFGQSLGASLSITALARNPQLQQQFAGVMFEAGFSRFGTIGREVAARSPLTWLVQYPVEWLLPKRYDPLDAIDELTVPLLLVHSTDDTIVPFHHGKTLFAMANEPKRFVETSGPHIQAIANPQVRQSISLFLEQLPSVQTQTPALDQAVPESDPARQNALNPD